jgi:HEAT repeat protein
MPLEVRLAAAASLARFSDARAPLFALNYATDQTPGIRAQAAAILGEARDPHYLPNLAAMLNDTDEQVKISAAAAIIKITDAR